MSIASDIASSGWSPASLARDERTVCEPVEISNLREACAHLTGIVNRHHSAYHNGPSIHGPSAEMTAWLLANAPPPFRYEHEGRTLVSFTVEFVGVGVSVYISDDDEAWPLVAPPPVLAVVP